MSEKVHHSPEHKSESLDLSAEIEKNLKRAEKEAEHTKEHQPHKAEIKKHVEQHAISGKEVTVGEKEQPKSPDFGTYKEMKGQTYKRSLKHIQRQLSGPERTMSKVMHQKTIDTVSEGLGKTVARPSGILGAGIVALAGTSFLLYMAKKYGFEYNPLMFFALILTGFVIGIILELFIRGVQKIRH